MHRISKRLPPAVVLFFLPSMISELLTGNLPPAKYFNPLLMLLMVPMYGFGAIIVRELTVRWKKGWVSLLILGAVYGILEEAIACSTFYNPQYPGMMEGTTAYGRWLGTNWVWAVGITIYHTFVSIGIPIMLVELCFPAERRKSWVSTRILLTAMVYFVVDIAILNVVLSGYRIPIPHLIVTIAVCAILILIAKRLPAPADVPVARSSRVPRPFWFLVMGTASVLMSYILPSGMQMSGVAPIIAIAVMLAMTGFIGWLMWRMAVRGTAWTDRHRLALVSGALIPYILFAPIRELTAKTFPSPATGMGLVGVIASIFLITLNRRIKG